MSVEIRTRVNFIGCVFLLTLGAHWGVATELAMSSTWAQQNDEAEIQDVDGAQNVPIAVGGMPSAPRILAAKRFEYRQILAVQIEEMDRVCVLDKKQKLKLRIAGKRTITRTAKKWHREYGKMMGLPLNRNPRKKDEEPKEIVFTDADEIDEMTLQMTTMSPNPLRANGLISQDAFWQKTVKTVLSDAQFQKLKEHVKQKLDAQRKMQLEYIVETLGRDLALDPKHSQKLADIILPHLPLDISSQTSLYDTYRLMYYASKAEIGKLKGVLSDAQIQRWKLLVKPFEQIGRAMEEEGARVEALEDTDSEAEDSPQTKTVEETDKTNDSNL